jgi:outer membrane protein OmpA-like peptidoglycan-associated protein
MEIIRLKQGLLAVAFCSGSVLSWSQADPCLPFEEVKSEKALEKAENTSKYSLEKRTEILRDAWESESTCFQCAQELGHLLFHQFQRSGQFADEAESVLVELVGACPDYHAEPWYELGALAYARGDASLAMDRFEHFLDFPADRPLGKRYDRQAEEVREVMVGLEFERAFRAHERDVELIPVATVNTSDDEYLPALSPDGSLLFLTHAERVKPKGDVVSRLVERFQWAHREAGQIAFTMPEDLDRPFNDGTHYGGASISVDNRELYIAASNPVPQNPDNIDLFVVKYEVLGMRPGGGFEYQWGPLTPLPGSINSPDGWEAQPSFSADGTELFFAAVKAASIPDENGNPTMDLMRAERAPDGSWKTAEPILGLNTAFNEKSPFLHPDGKTLYFSSDRVPGGGGYDIWYSRRQEDESWGTPVNVGAPINTTGDEHGLVVAADGFQAYLGSRRTGTRGLDILGLRLPPPHRAAEVTIVRGSVLTPAGTPDTTVQVGLLDPESMERTYLEVNRDDGTFARAMEASAAEDLVVFVEGPETAFDALLISAPEVIEVPESQCAPSLELKAQPIETSSAYEMRDLLYATSSSEISPRSHPILLAFADYLNRHPSLKVAIHGHTDDVGNLDMNMRLSQERAAAVKAFLVEAGVPDGRLSSQGFGPNRPRETNDTEAGRAANRRTEFVIEN